GGAAADHRALLRPGLAGLVVGGPQRAVRRSLHQIDRAAQADALVEGDRIPRAVRIALRGLRQAERQLESPRSPAAVLADPPQPLPQVELHAGDAIVPDPL